MERIALTRRAFIASSVIAAATRPTHLLAQGAPIKIGVGSDPVYSSFYLAAHEKMFEAKKLNVALQLYADGSEALNALVAQQVSLAAAAEPTHMVRFARAEMRPLAVVYQSGRYIKMVLGKDIDNPGKIKKFGIVPGSVSEYAALLALKMIGLDASTVQMVRSGPPELPALLARGDIDAFFAWEPWPTNGIKQGGRVIMTSKEVGYTDTMWITAAAAWFDSNTEAARGILKVLARSCEIVVREPERAAAAVQAVTRIPVAQTLSALKDVDPGVRDFTDADFESFDGIAAFLAQQKVTPSVVDFRRVIQRGFYKPERA
ncbi:ABC transporter substrate-binding protein [Bradyrhizobium sp. AUGA SZCCT0431]|uniref:ABC transporter substrate-binding protein n=1 Tax=Bradyrhizobium sp. AUGA SZCCT0431 TaxID=2807674 RepID=UPI001BA67CF3|nr:ABC transporter substrate-binding protein [Bradyrhizobium sp. AUGA SZCCT0431]MBR1147135.1 ABC transporter substrate-binding protein [Bradyrhizobium sp. AUGA SZCCT0431]